MRFPIASVSFLGLLVTSQLPQAPRPPQAVTQMARVSGQVIEEGTNTPVTGVHVFVLLDSDLSTPFGRPAGALPESVTDRDGRYHFDTLPAGRYRIAAQKAGFEPPMEPSTMQMFEVAAGQTLEGLTVSLRRGGVIAGRVLDPLGQPLAEGSVTALLKRLSSNDRPAGLTSSGTPLLIPSGQSQTNDLGEFRIFGLSPGEYVVAANPRSAFGGAATRSSATTMTSTFFPGTADVSAAQVVTVQAGQTVSDVTIRLINVPAFQVSGVVVDEAGAPLAGAMVMLMDGPGDSLFSLATGPRGMSQSDAGGRFSFGEVPAGSYTLQASGGGGGFFGISGDFIIDSSGTPRAGPSRPRPAPERGTIEVTIENENVGDLKLVVPRSP